MRLTCPECGAQYEIDAALIPPEGRDVQCSNCSHTWFELSPAPSDLTDTPAPDAAAEEALAASEPSDATDGDDTDADDQTLDDDRDAAESDAEPETAEAGRTAPVAQHEDEPEEDADADGDWDWPKTRVVPPPPVFAAPDGGAPKRRSPADDATLEILREEADREIAKRRANEPDAIERQPDLGLGAPSPSQTPSRALRARMARLRGEDEGEGTDTEVEETYTAPRRDLLPDIEEIKSSLGPAHMGRGEAAGDEIERRKGFRAGFATSVAVAVLLVALYAWAPQIAESVPAAEGAIIAYVDLANAARDGLSGLFRANG